MGGWWLESVRDLLSQGDVLESVTFSVGKFPLVTLQKRTLPGKATGWAEDTWSPNAEGIGHSLAEGRRLPALVVSHDCEMDKPKRRVLVHVAPIVELRRLPTEEQEKVLSQQRPSLLPLQGMPPTNGEYFADLRAITPVDLRVVTASVRIASMTDDGRDRLQAQLISFWTYRKLPAP